jgi:hypothetical protein
MFNLTATHCGIQLNYLGDSSEISHKIQHDDLILLGASSKATTQLLDENASRMGGSHKNDHIDIGHVDSLVEQIDRRDEIKRTRSESGKEHSP